MFSLVLPESQFLKQKRLMSAHTCFLSILLYSIMTHVAILCFKSCLIPVLSCPPFQRIYSLFIDFCSANEFFYAWFVLIDYADVSYICKSFEPRISAVNLCHTAFLQRVDWFSQRLHISWQDQAHFWLSFFFFNFF